MNNIAIFCGSKYGSLPIYQAETEALCIQLARHNRHIIYGGGNAGLMGTVANTVLAHGGTVTGIIPQFLHTQERLHSGVTELIVTATMHQRKQALFARSSAAIILPGGYGTLDELFELLTWNQLELHQIKVFIYNINGFYNALLAHIQQMGDGGFLYTKDAFVVLEQANDILPYL